MTEQKYGEHGRCEATASSTGERCKQPATGSHGKCRYHGGSSLKGADHPNFKSGKTSKYFKSKLSDRQREVYDEMTDALDDPSDALDVLSHVATRMILLGEHSNDPAMVREGRQLLSEFNIVPNADEIEMNHSGEVETSVSVPDHVADAVATAAESNLEDGDGE